MNFRSLFSKYKLISTLRTIKNAVKFSSVFLNCPKNGRGLQTLEEVVVQDTFVTGMVLVDVDHKVDRPLILILTLVLHLHTLLLSDIDFLRRCPRRPVVVGKDPPFLVYF